MLESKFYFKKVIIKYYTPALFVGFMNINSFKHIDLIIKKHLDMIGTIETKKHFITKYTKKLNSKNL